ncbi:hypothetical protein [Streptomyces tauricus]|uniref:hypothetical protein n=1 Tax=Streptomyces tauricus TaxID=68274 RepID=UPI003824DE08
MASTPPPPISEPDPSTFTASSSYVGPCSGCQRSTHKYGSGGLPLCQWRRVAALMVAEGWAVYEPERDVQGSAWAREREERRTQALARRAVWQKDQRDAREELKAQVSPPPSPPGEAWQRA